VCDGFARVVIRQRQLQLRRLPAAEAADDARQVSGRAGGLEDVFLPRVPLRILLVRGRPRGHAARHGVEFRGNRHHHACRRVVGRRGLRIPETAIAVDVLRLGRNDERLRQRLLLYGDRLAIERLRLQTSAVGHDQIERRAGGKRRGETDEDAVLADDAQVQQPAEHWRGDRSHHE